MLERIYTHQLQRVIDVLYMENYGDFHRNIHFKNPYLIVEINSGLDLYFHCEKINSVNPFQLLTRTILTHHKMDETFQHIAMHDVFNVLTAATWWPSGTHQKAVRYWHDNLKTAEKIPQLLSLAAASPSSLVTSEYLSLATDRPFHPFAHAKGELTPLVTEQSIEVCWWAFKTEDIINNMDSIPHEYLLSDAESNLLLEKLADLSTEYLPFPLLETQHNYLTHEKNQYEAIDLNHRTAIGPPTSSLRTLISEKKPELHLKLSTNAKTLGAIRSMPARYLANGHAAYDFLNEVIQQDQTLRPMLELSDETHWWVLGKKEPIVQNQGVLGCQIRYLPAWTRDDSIVPITMSALSCSYINPWESMGIRGDVWSLLEQLSKNFIQTFLSLWSYGIMPECHGQNTVVCYQNNQFKSFILRDHDTLRICPSVIEENGLTTPVYSIDTSTPNSLVLKTREELLNYFITLGIQINLYPIALASLKYTTRSETDFWDMLQQQISGFMANKTLSAPAEECIRQQIFEKTDWPFKQLFTPLLAQEQDSTSMPSKIGRTVNPYHALYTPDYEMMDQ
ncbi:IucA/IucC family protein [Acinetobacter sp. WZC-1]|uniref:IucA/IucC family protein n=1 Tax=Acinetobacter sp. WZC-1 TaxID=3459034 RepID=UPI00403DF295